MAIRKEYNQSWTPYWGNMPSGGTGEIPIASEDTLGGVKVGDGLDIEEDGTLNTDVDPYELPIASASTLGGVKVGNGLSVDAETGELSNNNPTQYTLPIASANTLGGIKVGNGLSIDASGVLSAAGSGAPIQKISASNTSLEAVGLARAAADNIPELIYIPEMKLKLNTNFQIGKINSGATVSNWDYQKSRSMLVGRIVAGGYDTPSIYEGAHVVQSLEIPVDGTDAPCVIIRDAIMKRVTEGSYQYFYIKYGKVVVTNTKAGGGYLANGLTGIIFGASDGQYAGDYTDSEFDGMGEIDITSLVKSAAEQGIDDTNFPGAVAKFRVKNGAASQWVGNIVSNTIGPREIYLFKSFEKSHIFAYGIGSSTVYTDFAVDINSSGDGNGFMLTSDYYVIKTPAAV